MAVKTFKLGFKPWQFRIQLLGEYKKDLVNNSTANSLMRGKVLWNNTKITPEKLKHFLVKCSKFSCSQISIKQNVTKFKITKFNMEFWLPSVFSKSFQ